MDFYEVLEKRRTYRDFSDREVSDEILKRVIGAAFKAPTNDHLRQLEFVVVRGRENIAKIIAPLAKNMAAFKELVAEVDESDDEDQDGDVRRRTAKTAKDVDTKRPACYPFLPPTDMAVAQTRGAKLAQLFRFGMVCFGEHAARSHR